MCIRFPFIVKLNHNELLTYPTVLRSVMFGTVRDAWNMGAAVGATIYFWLGGEPSPGWSRSPKRSTMRMSWYGDDPVGAPSAQRRL